MFFCPSCSWKEFKISNPNLFQQEMQKAVISWIGVRKFITTDKRKLFYEPSSAKMNSRNFLFFIKEPVFLNTFQKRINVDTKFILFTMKVCVTSHKCELCSHYKTQFLKFPTHIPCIQFNTETKVKCILLQLEHFSDTHLISMLPKRDLFSYGKQG